MEKICCFLGGIPVKKGLLSRVTIGVFCLFILAVSANASIHVSYTLEDMGSSRWKATYQVENVSWLPEIQWFSIFFDYGLYDHLSGETLPPLNGQWQEDAKSPLLFSLLSFPGFYDVRTTLDGIAPGQTATGFAVSFDWLGEGPPTGGQRFEIYDLHTPSISWIGTTTYIPEPATLLILLVGMLAVMGRPFHRPLRG